MSTMNIVYLTDDGPGITRRRRGRGWSYHHPCGEHIKDEQVIVRLNGIAMPPAYTDCWFSPMENSHLQATGFDAAQRKQYRYHPQFRLVNETRKFDRLAAFGSNLPDMRKRVAADLRQRKACKTRALAAIVRLLDSGLLRIGNDCYARTNGTYGATTLEKAHVEASNRRLRLQYKAKSGKQRKLSVTDRGLLRFVRDMQELPGQRLFQYVDEDGDVHDVHSHDVNNYIRSEIGEGYSAKDFRTFGASTLAYRMLAESDDIMTVKTLTTEVAQQLGNTPAVTRKSYIHPGLIDLCGTEPAILHEKLVLPRRTEWLSREERGLIAYFS